MTPSSSHPRLEILVRSFHGHEGRLRTNLLPTLAIFVNRREFPFAVVLDGESEADHELGDRLIAEGLCDRVAYEPLPSDWKRLFQGVALPPPRGYPGFDRQQWSTFHIDLLSDRDAIGAVDSDATFSSYLTRRNIFSNEGRIHLGVYQPTARSRNRMVRSFARSKGGCAYRNDPVALGEPVAYECMYTNRMPIWFWRSTFAACRSHIARKWNLPFDAAFEAFSRAPYSTFNILANYAIKHEPERYEVRLMDSPDGNILTVGQNGCLSTRDIVAGGLRSHRLPPDERLPEEIRREHRELMADRVHLNRWAYEGCFVTVDPVRAKNHYETVGEELAKLPPEQRGAMRAALIDFTRNRIGRVMITPATWSGRRKQAEDKIRKRLKNHRLLKAAALWVVTVAARLRGRWD